MRVLDASVVTDSLATSGAAGDRARTLVAAESWLHVPAMLAAEVPSALRRMTHQGALDPTTARTAVRRAGALRTRQYPFEPFLVRAWDLRDNVTPYAAGYVALAEALDAVLVIGDDRLRRAVGPRCAVLSTTEALAVS